MLKNFPVFSLEPRMRILHLSWGAFFVSFVVWFGHAPLIVAIRETFGLSKQEVAALLTLNVALTIPARILVGVLVDKVGPRVMFSALLAISGVFCLFFACAQNFAQLATARFLLGFVGAGFVVGIRIIGEWFPARETGLAQGLYAGLGNFGSAAAAVTLPTLAYIYGGPEGWRFAIATTAMIALGYSYVFYRYAADTPKGSTYFSPKKFGAMEVTSKRDFALYCLIQLPLIGTLALLGWRLGYAGLNLYGVGATYGLLTALAALLVLQIWDCWRINKGIFHKPVDHIHRYKFSQVAVLSFSYFITFGSELAVVSILPLVFKDVFGLSLGMAGLVGASFGLTTFFARPIGGWLSDIYGRQLVLVVCLVGTAVGYFGMSTMTPARGVPYAVVVTLACSLFVNAGNGAVYAMLPMIKRRLTGQIAGMVGAFGNVGGVLFLTIYGSFDASGLFLVAAIGSAMATLLVLLVIRNPQGQITEVMPDGTIALIDVT